MLRRRWDPVMAARAPAHVRVAYPEEAPDLPLLAERMREAARSVPPFLLTLGDVTALDEGRGGVFVAVGDGRGLGPRTRAAAPPTVSPRCPVYCRISRSCTRARPPPDRRPGACSAAPGTTDRKSVV